METVQGYQFERKLASWLGKMLSYGDHLVLINYVLTSLPMLLLSFFEIPKRAQKYQIFYRCHSFGKVMS
jgi:hypothetical protein